MVKDSALSAQMIVNDWKTVSVYQGGLLVVPTPDLCSCHIDIYIYIYTLYTFCVCYVSCVKKCSMLAASAKQNELD